MKRSVLIGAIVALSVGSLWGQSENSQAPDAQPTLRVTTRDVLVDVIVTDHSGKPVTGLSRDRFAVTDQRKSQSITFFEENGKRPAQAMQMPKLPPDVFSNFSPFPQPPVVNVLLLDSLNTAMTLQMNMHYQVKKFLEHAKPGSRSAIFTMGRSLRLIQGFTDDPAMLEAALENKKNIEVEPATMMKSQAEQKAQNGLVELMNQSVDSHGGTAASPGMVGALQTFFDESDSSQSSDRMIITLANLRRLAEFLRGVPGRKNIIWFAQKVPAVFNVEGGMLQLGNPAVDDEIRQTLADLANERAAIYTISPRGVGSGFIETVDDPKDRDSDQLNAELLAEQSGGRAFASTNAISDVIEEITSNSSHFYTLSYTPENKKMDGSWHKIEVNVAGGNYKLSYRRGYFAIDSGRHGRNRNIGEERAREDAVSARSSSAALLPFMGLGMPQTEEILYKVRIVPSPVAEKSRKKNESCRYGVDFAVDSNDVNLKPEANGNRRGSLVVSMMIYDRYGNLVSHQEHLAALNFKPDAYAALQGSGVALHADIATPKGNYWLRTGIYDESTRKVGTLEIPLAEVTPAESAAASHEDH